MQLTHLHWMGGVMAPGTFRTKMAEPERPPEPPRRALLRRFTVEVDPETGRSASSLGA